MGIVKKFVRFAAFLIVSFEFPSSSALMPSRAHATEAESAGAEGRRPAVASAATRVEGDAVPATATKHAGRARQRPARITPG